MAIKFDDFVASLMGGGGAPAPSPIINRVAPQPRADVPVARMVQQQPVQSIPQGAMPESLIRAISGALHGVQNAPEQPVQSAPRPVRNVELTPDDYQRMDQGPYFIVEYTDQQGGTHGIFVPEQYMERLPANARVIVDDPVTNPQQINNARNNGALLDQQEPAIQSAFVSGQTEVEKRQADRLSPDIDYGAGFVYTPAPLEADVYKVSDLAHVAAAMDEGDDKEYFTALTAWLQANGHDEIRADDVFVRGDDGQFTMYSAEEARAIEKAEREQAEAQAERARDVERWEQTGSAEPIGTKLPDLTTTDLREMGMDAEANELEQAGIASVPDGSMAIRDANGKVRVVAMPAERTDGMFADTDVIVFGGKSTGTLHPTIGDQIGNVDVQSVAELLPIIGPYFQKNPGATDASVDMLSAATSVVLPLLDKARVMNVSNAGEVAYKHAKDDSFLSDKGLTNLVQALLPKGIEENTMIPGLDFQIWVNNHKDEVIDAYENGYTDPDTGQEFTGGHAVWEKYSSTQPKLQKTINDVVYDPLTYTPAVAGALMKGGAALKGVEGVTGGLSKLDRANDAIRLARGAETITDLSRGRRLTGDALITAGRVMQAPDVVMDAAVAPVFRGGGRAIKSVPGMRQLLEESVPSRFRNMKEMVEQAQGDLLRRRQVNPEALAPEPRQLLPGPDTYPDAPGVRPDPDPSAYNPNPSHPVDYVGVDPAQGGSLIPVDRSDPDLIRRRMAERDQLLEEQLRMTPEQAKQAVRQGELPEVRDYNRTGGKEPYNVAVDSKTGEVFVEPDIARWEYNAPGASIGEDVAGTDDPVRLVKSVYDTLTTLPERVRFFDVHDRDVMTYLASQADLRSNLERQFPGVFEHARDGIRVSDAEFNALNEYYVQRALGEAEYVIGDLIPAARFVKGDNWEIPEALLGKWVRPMDAAPGVKYRDSDIIMNAIFGTGDQVDAATRVMTGFAKNGNVRYSPESGLRQHIMDLREAYLSRNESTFDDFIRTVVNRERNADDFGKRVDEAAQLRRQAAPQPEPQQSPTGRPSKKSMFDGAGELRPASEVVGGTPAGGVSLDPQPRQSVPEPQPQPQQAVPEPQPQQAVPVEPPQAGVVTRGVDGLPVVRGDGVSDVHTVAVSDLKSTARMTAAEREAVGLPGEKLQPRADDFSEQTAKRIEEMGWNRVEGHPIVYTVGTDGNPYIIAGHSRVEGARRIGKADIDAYFIPRENADLLVDVARGTNVGSAKFTNTEMIDIVRDMGGKNEPLETIGRELNITNPNGTVRTVEVQDILDASKLPLQSNLLAQHIDDGILDFAAAGALGRGVEAGVIDMPRVYSILAELRDPGSGITTRTIKNRIGKMIDKKMMPVQTNMNDLFGSSVVKDQWDDAGGMFDAMVDARYMHLRDMEKKYPKRKRTGIDRFDVDKMGEMPDNGAMLAQYNEDLALAQKMARDLGLPEKDVLTLTPDSLSDIAFGTIPGGPQLSRGARRVGNWLTEQPVGEVGTRFGSGRIDVGSGMTEAAQRDLLHRQDMVTNPNFGLNRRPLEAANRNLEDIAPSGAITRHDDSAMRTWEGRIITQEDTPFLDHRFADGQQVHEKISAYADEAMGQDSGLIRGKKATGELIESRDDALMVGFERVQDDYTAELVGTSPRRQRYAEQVYDSLSKKNALLPKNQQLPDIFVKSQAMMEAASSSSTLHLLRAYDWYGGFLRELTLYNPLVAGPRYFFTQVIGNSITGLLNQTPDAIKAQLSPRWMNRGIMTVADGADNVVARQIRKMIDGPVSAAEAERLFKETGAYPAMYLYDEADDLAAELGLGSFRKDVARPVRDQTTGEIGSMMKWEKRFRIGSKDFGIPGSKALRQVRDTAGGSDVASRRFYWNKVTRGVLDAETPNMRKMMLDHAPAGADKAEIARLWDENLAGRHFGSDRIRDVYSNLKDPLGNPIHQGYVERMARDWETSVQRIDKFAREEVNRLYFSGNMTNLDEALQRVVFFHYWASRAMPLYTEAMLRDPRMFVNYLRLQEAMDKDQDKWGVANYMRMFDKSIMGFVMYMRPDAMFDTALTYIDDNGWTPDGETWLGKLMRTSPAMPHPVLASVINFLGLAGNTFAPDPLALGNTINMITNFVNLGPAFSEDGTPIPNFYTEGMSWLRGKTSRAASRVLPGSTEVPYMESNLYMERDIKYLIMDQAEADGFDPDGPEARAAMADPSSPWYREAFQNYVISHNLLSLSRVLPTSVMYPKIRTERGDRIRAGIRAPEGSGFTREEWYSQKNLATRGDDRVSNALMVQGDEYYDLGTEPQRNAYRQYNAIVYNTVDGNIFVGDEKYDRITLYAMTEKERRDLADRWAAEHDATDAIKSLREERSEYRKTHKEWDNYYNWMFEVQEYGEDAYWIEGKQYNENAARWFDQNAREVENPEERRRMLTSVDAYMAYNGIRKDMYTNPTLPVDTSPGAPYKPAGAVKEKSSSGGKRTYGDTAEGIKEDLAEYQKDMDEFRTVTGISNIDSLNPMARSATIAKWERDGIEEPYMSARLKRYVKWADEQPVGSDTSPEAYEEWYKQNKKK